jgi:hypothetical protein
MLDVQSFRAADCDNDHYLAVANVRERPAGINRDRTDFTWRGSMSRN